MPFAHNQTFPNLPAYGGVVSYFARTISGVRQNYTQLEFFVEQGGSNQQLLVTRPMTNVQYLIVAGGGGGGDNLGGGGGGGGVITGTFANLAPGTYDITIGAGGLPGTTSVNNPRGGNGGNSSAFGFTAIGGGGGGSESGSEFYPGLSGGSGGGAAGTGVN